MCYDSGHEHYWSPDVDWLSLYGNRIFAIHLHDNTGDKDAHLVPFEGTIDWKLKMRQIAQSSYTGTMTIEAEYNTNGGYIEQSLEAFLLKIHKAGVQLEELLQSYRK